MLLGRPVALPSVLEPVADLGERQARPPGQVAFLVRRRIPVLQVTVFEGVSRLLLETVHGLLAVPNGLGQRVLLAQPVLIHSAQRTAADLLGFQIVRFEPQLLQLHMMPGVEALTLQYGVQLVERVSAQIESSARHVNICVIITITINNKNGNNNSVVNPKCLRRVRARTLWTRLSPSTVGFS